MLSGSPQPLVQEVLSEPPFCTRMCLRDGHAANHRGSRLSLWIGGQLTLQGRLLVRASSIVKISIGHSPCGLLYCEEAYRP